MCLILTKGTMKKGYFRLVLVLVLVVFLTACTDPFDMTVSQPSAINMSGIVLPVYSGTETITLKQNLTPGNYTFYQAVLLPYNKITIFSPPASLVGTFTGYTSSIIINQLNQTYQNLYGQLPPSDYRWYLYRTALRPVNLGSGSLGGYQGVIITVVTDFTARQIGTYLPTYAFGAESFNANPPVKLNDTWKLVRAGIELYECHSDADCPAGTGCVNLDCTTCNGYPPQKLGCCTTLVSTSSECSYTYATTASKDCLRYKNANVGSTEKCFYCLGNATSDFGCENGLQLCQQYSPSFSLGSWSPFVCTSNADCNDNNPCTTESCTNPSTCNARCSRTNVTDGTQCGNGGICSTGQCVGECPAGTNKVSRLCIQTDPSNPSSLTCTTLEGDYVCVNPPYNRTNSCSYNTTFYTNGQKIYLETPYPKTLKCSNGYWCPDGFEYNTTVNNCVFTESTCEQGSLSQITCEQGTGQPSTWGLWTDQNAADGTNPFWNPVCFFNAGMQNNSNPPFYKACCEATDWADKYYFTAQSVTPSITDLYPGINLTRTNETICGDQYLCGAADGICPEIYGGYASPGICNREDVDCCTKAIWNGTSYYNRNFVWTGSSCCGNNLNEFFTWEKGIFLNTSRVLDADNSSSCCTQSSDCVDDSVCYANASRKNIDDATGDEEICINGYWHDHDESSGRCTQGGFRWDDGTTGLVGTDDYDLNTTNGFCDGDDGVTVYGTVNEQITFGEETTRLSASVSVVAKTPDLTRTIATTTSNSAGYYELLLPPGVYTITFSKTRYVTETLTAIEIHEQTQQDILLQLSSECQSDCTKNDGVCHADCSGKNSCYFYNSVTRTLCDNKRAGWLIDYPYSPYGRKVECCTGRPRGGLNYTQPSAQVQDLEFPSDIYNIVTVKKYLYYRGQPITMYVTLYRCDDNELCKQTAGTG